MKPNNLKPDFERTVYPGEILLEFLTARTYPERKVAAMRYVSAVAEAQEARRG